jgi:hypothetical protein
MMKPVREAKARSRAVVPLKKKTMSSDRVRFGKLECDDIPIIIMK